MLSPRVNLTEGMRKTISAIVEPVADRIGKIRVFGSRAYATARPASDLDLVVLPPYEERDLSKLRAMFDESNLPIFVDVIGYLQIADDRFRAEVDKRSIPLLARDEDNGSCRK